MEVSPGLPNSPRDNDDGEEKARRPLDPGLFPRDQQDVARRISVVCGSPLGEPPRSAMDWERRPPSPIELTRPHTSTAAQDDSVLYTPHMRRILSNAAVEVGSVKQSLRLRMSSTPVIRVAGKSVGAFRAWTHLFLHYGAEAIDSRPPLGAASECSPLVSKPKDSPAPTIPTGAAFLIMFKSFLGTGELFMPQAYREGGTVFTTIAILAMGAAVCYCILSLVECRRQYRDASYAELGGLAFGPGLSLTVHLSLVLDLLCTVVAYFIFVAQNVLTALQALTSCSRWTAHLSVTHLALAQVVFHLPLCWLRDIKYFAVPALCAELFMLVGLGYVYLWDVQTASRVGFHSVVPFNREHFGVTLGLLIFSFDGVALALPLEEAMERRQDYAPLLLVVVALMAVLYISFGWLNYAVLGPHLYDVVFLSLPQTRFLSAVEGLYALAVFFTVPLNFFALARMLEADLQRLPAAWAPGEKGCLLGRPLLMAGLGLVACSSSTQLANFVAVASAFSSVPLCFIYPPLIHLRLGEGRAPRRALDYCLAGLGVACTAYTGSHALDAWRHASEAAAFTPFCPAAAHTP